MHSDVRKEWEPRDLPTAEPRWRPRLTRRTALVAGAVLIAIAGIVFLTIPTWYRPLEEGSASGLHGGRDIDDDAFGDRFVIGYEDRTYAYGLLSLYNDGRFPLRIERVGNDREEFMHSLVEIDPERTLLPPPNVYGVEGAPFTPFTLDAGEERAVGVALWMDDCEFNGSGAFAAIGSVPVRYRILGMARTEWVDMRTPWTVHAPEVCPRPRDLG